MTSKLSLPRPELVAIAASVSSEKNIDSEIVFSALEAAVEKVAKNKYGYDTVTRAGKMNTNIKFK